MKPRGFARSDRALELLEKHKLSHKAIAERMCTNVNNVRALLSQARKRRDAERLRAAALAQVMGHNI